jgi:hypothetical protein
MNPNPDPPREQPAIVDLFASPSAFSRKHAPAAPPLPFALAGAVAQTPDDIQSPASAGQEPDPDWSVSPPPKRPPFKERLPKDGDVEIKDISESKNGEI